MKIQVYEPNGYKRRGKVCSFTFKISGFAPLPDPDEDEPPYTEAYCWADFQWSGENWELLGFTVHKLRPPPRNPYPGELIGALAGSATEARALKAMSE